MREVFEDLTAVTLADKDTNSIQIDITRNAQGHNRPKKNFLNQYLCQKMAIFIGPRCLGSDLVVRVSVSKRGCADLTDMTLADKETNSIPTDNAKRAI